MRSTIGIQHCIALALGAALASHVAQAQPAERSGKDVVTQVCAVCHATGEKGAPRIGDRQAWAPLASRGLGSLTDSALKGVRNMPAHGGNPGLSDIEIERAVIYMVNQSGGQWTEPLSGVTPAAERRGKAIVDSRCVECHGTGKGGAPGIGDQSAWIPRLKHGLDFLVRSAIHGHGAMPPRGGMVDLTDSEIRGAIVYMLNPAVVAEKSRATTVLSQVPASNRKIENGTEVYLGVVAAETLRAQQSKTDKERAAIPRGRNFYHVNISLFDAKTREVVTGAQVEASVTEPVSGGEKKTLQPERFDGVQSYGNFFRMSGTNPYTITVRIVRPGSTKPIEVKFDYKRS